MQHLSLDRVAAERSPPPWLPARGHDGGVSGSDRCFLLRIMPPGRLSWADIPLPEPHRGGGSSPRSRGRRCILTPTADTDPDRLGEMTRMWDLAVPSDYHGVLKHDGSWPPSPSPHMVAYSLVNAVEGYDPFTKVFSSIPRVVQGFHRCSSTGKCRVSRINRMP